jgi:FtsP/CotA-like multicopper oxidase with cupredoxin domain
MRSTVWRAKGLQTAAFLFGIVLLAGCSDGDSTASFGAFPQPEVRSSSNGVLDTSLTAQMATNVVRNNFPPRPEVSIETPTYEGKLIGPTLRLHPGDLLRILFHNRLPNNPEGARCAATGGFCGFPHDPFTTNFHTHGLTVSPLGNSDNVLRQFVPGGDYPIEVAIPSDHPSGTYWYHPHKHGSVSFQFFGGMAGFLILEGGPGTLDTVPEVAAAKEVLMGFQVLRTDVNGRLPFVNQDAASFSSLPAGRTKNGNCVNAPFKQCIGPYGATGDLCADNAQCPQGAACIGRSCSDDADCSV